VQREAVRQFERRYIRPLLQRIKPNKEAFRQFERRYIRPLLRSIRPKKHKPESALLAAIDELSVAQLFEGFRCGSIKYEKCDVEHRRKNQTNYGNSKWINRVFGKRPTYQARHRKKISLFNDKSQQQIEQSDSSECHSDALIRILIDLRCLQDSNYVGRGVGSHALFLLEQLHEHFQKGFEIIGLIDPTLEPLDEHVRSFCVDVRTSFALPDSYTPTVFLELSPMTHDTRLPALLLDRPNVLPMTVIYDFIPLDQPEKYLPTPKSQMSYQAAMKWLHAYQLFLPISQHSGDLLVQKFAMQGEQIKVTGVALRSVFEAHLFHRKATVQEASPKTSIMLFAGGPDERKDLETALDAHAYLQEQGLPNIKLVIIGNYPDKWQRKALSHRKQQAENIQFLKRISDEELADWYERATVTVSTSVDEGFSMPVIEAIACGSPVVVSDIPAHRELIADTENRFPVRNAKALAEKIKPFFTSPQHRKKVALLQRSTSERFTKRAVARRICEAIHEQIKAPATSSLQILKKRPRIAIVSPFPPDRSGVADYTKKTIEALSSYVEVDLYTDQPLPEKTSGIRAHYPISAAAWLRPDYDVTLSIIGNSHFHTKIIELHALYGGPCLVHDNRLAEITASWKGIEHLRQIAETSLKRSVEMSEACSWMENPGSLPSMFYEEIIEKACPLLVHSRGIQKNVHHFYGVDAVYLPFCIYNNFKPEELTLSARQSARSALKIPEGQKSIVTLGIVSKSKLPHLCIQAVAQLQRDDPSVHLYFVGQADALKDELLDFAQRQGVKENIHFSSGWIDEDQYRQYLVAADAGIQLRNHFFGGLSGALLDCIAAGVPVATNRDLADAMEAPEYVYRVPDDPSSEDLATAIQQSLATRRCQKHEQLRRQYEKAHSFPEYATQLLDEILKSQQALKTIHRQQDLMNRETKLGQAS